ncbi:hemerythrin domain-containing protein [Bradyrhizobium sp.]|uniref:hemerythrin domain-containing protein n=1 Tax=Bradyrhizobium sp. TaxID=376 RepID=UPI003C64131A
MPKLINILLGEHQNIEKLLGVLEHELDIFDRGERPDYEVLQTIIQYFQDYPEKCHHPKEEMIFAKLMARDPVAARRFGDVEAEHETEASRLHGFAAAVQSILADQEFLREDVHSAMRAFIDHQREHLKKEEQLLFPAALKALLPDDWSAIDARLDDRKDPLFDAVVEEQFHDLQQTILRWEQEAEADRAALSRSPS